MRKSIVRFLTGLLVVGGLLGFFHVCLAQAGQWVRKADMPTPRFGHSTAVVDGKIYVIGGWHRGLVPHIDVYDPKTETWAKKAEMPTPRSDLSTSVVDGKIYAIGGGVPKPGGFVDVATVEVYDPKTDTWAKKKEMPTPRLGLSTSVVDGKIYAIGGQVTGIVEIYDPEQDQWFEPDPMPIPRGWFSTSAVGGKIYAIGGGRFGLPTVEVYHPQKKRWTPAKAMPTGRTVLSTSVVDGKIYAIGGTAVMGDFRMAFATVEVYDPARDQWTQIEEMPTARYNFATSAMNGIIYAFGGVVEEGIGPFNVKPIPTLEAYDTGIRSVSPKGKLTTTWGKLKVGD